MGSRPACAGKKAQEVVRATVVDGATQCILANKLGVSQPTISRTLARMHPALVRAYEKEALSVAEVALVCINEAIDVLETARNQENWAGVLAALSVLQRSGDLMQKAQESVGHQTTSAAVAGSDRDLLLAIAAEVEKRLK